MFLRTQIHTTLILSLVSQLCITKSNLKKKVSYYENMHNCFHLSIFASKSSLVLLKLQNPQLIVDNSQTRGFPRSKCSCHFFNLMYFTWRIYSVIPKNDSPSLPYYLHPIVTFAHTSLSGANNKVSGSIIIYTASEECMLSL